MLGNVLGRPRHALQRPQHALQRPRHACNVLGWPRHALQPRRPTSKENPPTFCLISYEIKGVVYHQASLWSQETWWYTTPFASQLIRQKVEGFSFDVGCLGRYKACLGRPRTLSSMPRTLQSMPRTLQGMPRTAEDVASMPKHALGTHNNNNILLILF